MKPAFFRTYHRNICNELKIMTTKSKSGSTENTTKICSMRNYIELSNAKTNGPPKIKHTYIHFESLPSRI
jgi:hypothetical protein